MTTSEVEKKPYLTPSEVARELDCTPRNVQKLIKDGKLPALKKSERKTVVSRWALETYLRKINGQPRLVTEVIVDAKTLAEQFSAQSGGMTPRAFYLEFKAGRVADTSQNMGLLVTAIALGAGGDGASEELVSGEPWAAAALKALVSQ